MRIDSLWQLMHLVTFADSAFPVGGFAFSNTLESAVSEGVVHDAATLEEYVRGLAVQSAYTDSVASLAAFRASRRNDIGAVVAADCALLRCKPGQETRTMLCRMGIRAAELAGHLTDNAIIGEWMAAIHDGRTPGCYPTAQGLLFAACGLDERMLFVAQQYGVLTQAAGAALRLMRVTHFDTQLILHRAACVTDALWDEVRTMQLDEMNSFFLQAEILGSIHEKGKSRMFMN